MSYIPPGHEKDKKYDKNSFDYSKAEDALWDAGAKHPDEIYDFSTKKGAEDFMSEYGLDASDYEKNTSSTGYSIFDDEPHDDGCYLTTACVNAKGLADDCHELQTLRRFRDTFMSSSEEGRAEIKDYYIKAPQIVRAVNSMPQSGKIWLSVYDNLILPCIRLIESNEYERAYAKYKEYTLDMFTEYVNK